MARPLPLRIAHFCIVPNSNGFSVQLNGSELVQCVTVSSAARFAVLGAHRTLSEGYRARVTLQDGEGLHVIWTDAQLVKGEHRVGFSTAG